MRISRFLPLVGLILSGCAVSEDFHTRKLHDADRPFKKILVVDIVSEASQNKFPTLTKSFEERVRSDFMACGIEATTMIIPMPLSLDLTLGNPAKDIQKKITEGADTFHPDYILRVSDKIFLEFLQRDFTLQMTEYPSQTLIWWGGFHLKHSGVFSGMSAIGQSIADSIIEQMNQDGVLTNCTPPK